MKVSELAEKTGLNSLSEYTDKEIEGVYISDMVTLQTHKNLIAAANLVDVAAVVFVRGKTPAADVIELARKAGIGLFVSDMDTWSFAVRLNEIGVK